MEALLGHSRVIIAAVLCTFLYLGAPSQPVIAQSALTQSALTQSALTQSAGSSVSSQAGSKLQQADQGFGQFRPSTGFEPAGFATPAAFSANQRPVSNQDRAAGQIKNVYKVEASRLDGVQPSLTSAQPIGVFRGQDFQTRNFYVQAGNANLAKAVGEAAEGFRRELAIQWLGYELPTWNQPCPIQVNISNQAHGETSFLLPEFGSGMPSDWEMKIYGPVDRLLDSVLPHEITHTIFATHFKQRLPRWVDEGACTMVEHESEKQKIHSMLLQYLSPRMGRGLPFNDMFVMRDYPADHHGMLALYAQGFSVSKYLIAQGGYEQFGRFIKAGLENENQTDGNRTGSIAAWTEAVDQFYHYESLSDLQIAWLDWVQDGSIESVATERYQRQMGQETAVLATAQVPDQEAAIQPAGRAVPAIWEGPAIGMLRGTEDSRGIPSNTPQQNANRDGVAGNIYQRLANGSPDLNAPAIYLPAQNLPVRPDSLRFQNQASPNKSELLEKVPNRPDSSLNQPIHFQSNQPFPPATYPSAQSKGVINRSDSPNRDLQNSVEQNDLQQSQIDAAILQPIQRRVIR